MEPIRCHFTIIFERVFRIYRHLLPALVIPLLSGGILRRPGIILLAFAGSLALFTAISTLAWLKTHLSADDEQLYITSGALWRKQLTIPFSKVNTVDLSRNLFQRVAGTCRIKIDTGAVSGRAKGDAETDLVFSLLDAERIRACILSLRTGVDSLHDDYVDLPEGASAADNVRPVQAAGSAYRRAESAGAAAAAGAASPPWSAAHAPSASGEAPARQPRVVFRARTRDFFLYGLTQNKVLTGSAIVISLFVTAGELLGDRVYDWVAGVGRQAGAILSRFELVALVLALIGLFLLYYILANLASILTAVVRFYQFRVSREGDIIHIEYGLLSVRSYTMPLSNIHAVIVRQNLLRQWLRQCSVELVSIGYGDERNEVALLFPMIPLDQLDVALGRILPEYQGTGTRTPAPARARMLYLLPPVIALLLLTAAASWLSPQVWLSLVATLPLLVWTRLLAHRHAAIGYSGTRIEVTTGGFNYREYRIRMAAVQSVGVHGTRLSERAGLGSYRIDYHAPAMRAIAHVRFLERRHLDDLRTLLNH